MVCNTGGLVHPKCHAWATQCACVCEFVVLRLEYKQAEICWHMQAHTCTGFCTTQNYVYSDNLVSHNVRRSWEKCNQSSIFISLVSNNHITKSGFQILVNNIVKLIPKRIGQVQQLSLILFYQMMATISEHSSILCNEIFE